MVKFNGLATLRRASWTSGENKEILNGNKTCARGRTCAFNMSIRLHVHERTRSFTYMCVYMFVHTPPRHNIYIYIYNNDGNKRKM